MSTTTLVIVGAAILVLVLVLVLLARTGRKPPEGPVDGMEMVDPSVQLVAPEEPLPEPGASGAMGLATAELASEPLTAAEPAGPPDPLTRMKGLGPKAEALLNSLGITRYDQIATWSDADVARIDGRMGAFKGRIVRDRWVEQAKLLAADDVKGFEAVFGKLG
jgi:predicted flap endonuclease-1-like 5' DNA nuclease